MKRGEVWLVELDPTVGSEIQKTRPCLIVSPPELHDHMRTVIVAPMTTGSQGAGFRVEISFQGKTGRIVLDQIRAVDKRRLVKRLGSAPEQTVSQTLTTLQNIFAP